MTTKATCIILLGVGIALAGCSRSEETQSGDLLRSDVPLRSAQYFIDHPGEATEMRAICDQWKGSQRSLNSWPSVVTSNCNFENEARVAISNAAQRKKFREQMGVD